MSEEYSEKLFKLLKDKYPNLSDEEIDRKAQRYAELGFLMGRLFLKQHSKRLEATLDQQNED